jgi:hypothetical protein
MNNLIAVDWRVLFGWKVRPGSWLTGRRGNEAKQKEKKGYSTPNLNRDGRKHKC